jgi:hypothetical protein
MQNIKACEYLTAEELPCPKSTTSQLGSHQGPTVKRCHRDDIWEISEFDNEELVQPPALKKVMTEVGLRALVATSKARITKQQTQAAEMIGTIVESGLYLQS